MAEPSDRRIVRHCSRCHAEIPQGANCGMLYLLERGIVTKHMIRVCAPCTRDAMEFLISRR